jgi:alpha/beta superfamily hydrolase
MRARRSPHGPLTPARYHPPRMAHADVTAAAFPTASGPLTLAGPAGALEAAVDLPEDDVAALPLVAIVCHPLPTEGGTMHNKVVTMTARALRELGASTVRFNFRGTGASEGDFDEGPGEVADLKAIAAWVRAQRPDDALWLAGFSFGAYVALCAAEEIAPDLLISIAPPAGRWDFERIATPTMPWLVIQGEADEIVDPEAVYAWLDELKSGAQLVRMPDTSHFFHRKLMDLRGAIKHGVKPYLPAPPAAEGTSA